LQTKSNFNGEILIDIPDRFNKNSPEVRALGSQAETGMWLMNYMCERIGIADLIDTDLLDLGCGARFVDSILNLGVPIRSYTGIDVDSDLITYFLENILDPRFTFSHWDAQNPFYNPDGKSLSSEKSLPIDFHQFNIICMFSVITHQIPSDARAIFSIARRYIRPDGHMFFSATITDAVAEYAEIDPSQPAAHSSYSMSFMTELLQSTGWKIISFAERSPNGLPIQDSFLCAPDGL